MQPLRKSGLPVAATLTAKIRMTAEWSRGMDRAEAGVEERALSTLAGVRGRGEGQQWSSGEHDCGF